MGEEEKNLQPEEASPEDKDEKSDYAWLGRFRLEEVKGEAKMCLPYKDPMFFASVFFALAGLALSFVFGWAFIECFITFEMFVVPLTYRLGKGFFYWIYIAVAFDVLFLLGVGIYVAVEWKDETECGPFQFGLGFAEEPDDPSEQNCNYPLWAGISFASAACWAISGLCMYLFLQSGKYDEFEKKYTEEFAAAAKAEAEENPEAQA